MKNLKFSILIIFSWLTYSVNSQLIVSTTIASGSNICNGTATLDTSSANGVIPINWVYQGLTLQNGGYSIDSLCPGVYVITYSMGGMQYSASFTINYQLDPCIGFSDTVYNISSSDSISCNGLMSLVPIAGTPPYTFLWSNGSTDQFIENVCPGIYCCTVTDFNGCTTSACDTIILVADTIFFDNNSCPNPTAVYTTEIEDCSLNYNSISWGDLDNNLYIDSITNTWVGECLLIDTNFNIINYPVSFQSANSITTGCYEFNIRIYCNQKIINVSSAISLELVGINEFLKNQIKLVKVTDLLGRPTPLVSNKILIKYYNDGTIEKVFVND